MNESYIVLAVTSVMGQVYLTSQEFHFLIVISIYGAQNFENIP